MSEALICPDCGGVVGGEVRLGVKPCRCFEKRSTSSPRVADEDASSAIDSPSIPKTDKICYVCQQNVNGKKRYKDKNGYICLPCAKNQEAMDKDLVSCAECGKRLKPAGLVNYRGRLICKRCDMDHKENDKVKVDKVKLISHAANDKKQLKNLLILAGVMGVIALISIYKLTHWNSAPVVAPVSRQNHKLR